MHSWQIENGAARFLQPRVSGALDPALPAAGLQHVVVDDYELPSFQPLQVQLAEVNAGVDPQKLDVYERGCDLVVTYAEQPAADMRAWLYWRLNAAAVERGALAAVELIASVQTSLLDSCPRLTTASTLAAIEVLQLADASRKLFATLTPQDTAMTRANRPACFLARLPGDAYSYLEIVHPGDTSDSRGEFPAPGRAQITHRLFSERLEKGVILRARILGVVLERRGDLAAAIGHWNAFLQEEPPLTT